MAWERRGQHEYYYRVRKVDGRVVRTYVGRGLHAELAAREDAERRAHRQAEKERLARLVAELDAADATLIKFIDGCDLLMKATLTTAGYHQHSRGEWRRRRVSKSI